MKPDGKVTVRLAGGRRVKMDDSLFQILYAAGAFDETPPPAPSEHPPEERQRPEESGLLLRVLLAVVVAVAVMALIFR